MNKIRKKNKGVCLKNTYKFSNVIELDLFPTLNNCIKTTMRSQLNARRLKKRLCRRSLNSPRRRKMLEEAIWMKKISSKEMQMNFQEDHCRQFSNLQSIYRKQLLNGRPNFLKGKKKRKSRTSNKTRKSKERKTKLSEGYSSPNL